MSDGHVHLIRFIRSNRILDIFGEKFTWDKGSFKEHTSETLKVVVTKKRVLKLHTVGFYGFKSRATSIPNPPHLLSGLMKCSRYGGAIVLVSGKGSGHYGCFNAKRKTCNNTLLALRKRIKETII
jgi:hypothetical protein